MWQHMISRSYRTRLNRIIIITCTLSAGLLIAGLSTAGSVAACCEGMRGNVDCSTDNVVDMGDLTALINYLYINHTPLCCREEANVDADPDDLVDIADLTALIDYLYISNAPIRLCSFTGDAPVGSLVGATNCKNFPRGRVLTTQPPDQDCIEYNYTEDYTLTIKHVNAGFNCCPELVAFVHISGDSLITIEELDSLINPCYCLCLFDMDYEITNLQPGIYRLNVIEPYRPSGDEVLDFIIDLRSPGSGVVCVTRSQYPWGFSN